MKRLLALKAFFLQLITRHLNPKSSVEIPTGTINFAIDSIIYFKQNPEIFVLEGWINPNLQIENLIDLSGTTEYLFIPWQRTDTSFIGFRLYVCNRSMISTFKIFPYNRDLNISFSEIEKNRGHVEADNIGDHLRRAIIEAPKNFVESLGNNLHKFPNILKLESKSLETKSVHSLSFSFKDEIYLTITVGSDPWVPFFYLFNDFSSNNKNSYVFFYSRDFWDLNLISYFQYLANKFDLKVAFILANETNLFHIIKHINVISPLVKSIVIVNASAPLTLSNLENLQWSYKYEEGNIVACEVDGDRFRSLKKNDLALLELGVSQDLLFKILSCKFGYLGYSYNNYSDSKDAVSQYPGLAIRVQSLEANSL